MNIKRWKYGQNFKIRCTPSQRGMCNKRGDCMRNNKILELQKKLQDNLSKAIKIAERNTIVNADGLVVLSKDDEWRDEDEWDELFNKTE